VARATLAGGETPATGSLAGAVVRTARPRQWVKNVLVFAAPGAAGVLTHGRPLSDSTVAFLLFCLGASGTYFVNDALDVNVDRLHPLKSRRPVARGELSTTTALAIGAALMASALALGATVARPKLALVLAIYIAVTLAYSAWLKDEPVVDLAAVASGFVLRAIAGGVATAVPLSNWFLIVASSGSLLMVSGKRHAEHLELGDERGAHRATLSEYSLPFLRYVRSVSSSVAITAYCLWGFEKAAAARHGGLWFELSAVPFALAVLRYALLLDAGQGGAPEEIVLSDRMLQLLGLLLILAFAIGLYVS
jgi:decaprenyl-phosphate phosphoribosyltransferase